MENETTPAHDMPAGDSRLRVALRILPPLLILGLGLPAIRDLSSALPTVSLSVFAWLMQGQYRSQGELRDRIAPKTILGIDATIWLVLLLAGSGAVFIFQAFRDPDWVTAQQAVLWWVVSAFLLRRARYGE